MISLQGNWRQSPTLAPTEGGTTPHESVSWWESPKGMSKTPVVGKLLRAALTMGSGRVSRMCPSTKPHARGRVPRMHPFGDASAPTAMHGTPSTPGGTGTRTSKWQRAEDITLIVVGSMTAEGIEARTPTHRVPGFFVRAFTAHYSRHGTTPRQTSRGTPGR
jgi:hypothetical protein